LLFLIIIAFARRLQILQRQPYSGSGKIIQAETREVHTKSTMVSLLWSLFLTIVAAAVQGTLGPPPENSPANTKNIAFSGKSTQLLNVIQVSSPVKVPGAACTATLMEHSFAYSYGHPFVGPYAPPDCVFNRVVLTLTVTSSGRQFDRLALMYFNDTEIWRTSTAEPTQNGILWSYDKDVSNYLSLFQHPQKLIFDLGNLIDDTYTGAFNTTLVATFYNGSPTDVPADQIIPISHRRSSKNESSAFRYPDDGPAANSLVIPRNVRRAMFSISACGQAKDEEFWWSNSLSSTVETFGVNNTLPGASPWREIQLLIDDKLAGVVWPFPIIFTGGVVPGFWRPIVGIDAYDLKEDEIDISAWLGVLSDGKEHKYEIRVVGLSDDGKGNAKISSVGSNWVLTGKIFLWLDAVATSITKGTPPLVSAPEPEFRIEQAVVKDNTGTNVTLNYHVVALRNLTVNGSITTSDGPKPAIWKQNLQFYNTGNITASGNNQTSKQLTTGIDTSSDGYARTIRYPLWCKSSAVSDPKTHEFSLNGDISRGKYFQVNGTSIFPSGLEYFDMVQAPIEKGFTTNTTQEGTALYHSIPAQNRTVGRGLTEQVFTLAREYGENNPESKIQTETLYQRHILAENGKILRDETMTLVEMDPIDPPPIRIQQDAPKSMDVSGLDVNGGLGRKYASLAIEPLHLHRSPTQLHLDGTHRRR
jgi:hypothetical protein